MGAWTCVSGAQSLSGGGHLGSAGREAERRTKDWGLPQMRVWDEEGAGGRGAGGRGGGMRKEQGPGWAGCGHESRWPGSFPGL